MRKVKMNNARIINTKSTRRICNVKTPAGLVHFAMLYRRKLFVASQMKNAAGSKSKGFPNSSQRQITRKTQWKFFSFFVIEQFQFMAGH